MKKLLLKLLRDIKESKGQFIAITLVITIGAFLFTGLSGLAKSIDEYVDNYYEVNNLSDLYVFYSQVNDDQVRNISNIEGINTVEARYTFEGTQEFEEYRSTLKISSIPDNNKINKSTLMEGEEPANNKEILLDKQYAEEHDYKIGDEILIKAQEKEFKSKISGLIENVEHTIKIKDAGDLIPNHKTYGVAYIPEEEISNVFGSLTYNEIMVDIKDDYDVDEIGEEIENKSDEKNYLYQLSKERTSSYANLNGLINTNKSLSQSLPIVFFIVAAVVTFITMSRTVDIQRNQIGIMKALGVKKSKILSYYLEYPMLTGIIGAILGGTAGFVLFKEIGKMQVSSLYSLPDFTVKVDIFSIIPTFFFSIIFGIVASYISCRKVLKEKAAEAMRPKSPRKIKKTMIEKNKALWKKISYGNKIILRNIFLNKKRALCSSIGVIVAILLLIIALGYKDSMTEISVLQTEDVYKYDLRVDYKVEVDKEKVELPGSVKEKYSLADIAVQVIHGDSKSDIGLVSTEGENDLINVYDDNGDRIQLNDNGVVIPKTYAEKYKLSEGDKFQIKVLNPEYNGKKVEVEVEAIAVQYSSQAMYCTPEYLEKIDIEYNPKTLILEVDNKDSIEKLYDDFNNRDDIQKLTTKEDLKESMDTILEQTYPVVAIFVISAMVLAAAAIYNIASINIFERSREIATLKVLGYSNNKIDRLIFVENILLTVFGIIIATPLGIKAFKLFTDSMTTEFQSIPSKIKLTSIVLAIIITLAVTIVSNLLLRKKVKKIDMIESLKSVE